jgi:hypothetical protein
MQQLGSIHALAMRGIFFYLASSLLATPGMPAVLMHVLTHAWVVQKSGQSVQTALAGNPLSVGTASCSTQIRAQLGKVFQYLVRLALSPDFPAQSHTATTNYRLGRVHSHTERPLAKAQLCFVLENAECMGILDYCSSPC